MVYRTLCFPPVCMKAKSLSRLYQQSVQLFEVADWPDVIQRHLNNFCSALAAPLIVQHSTVRLYVAGFRLVSIFCAQTPTQKISYD